MVDVLLVQPPVRDFYLTRQRNVPHALACLASPLHARGFSVEILDALASSKTRPRDLPPPMAYLRDYFGARDHSPFALFHQYHHHGLSFEALARRAARLTPEVIGLSSSFTAYSGEALHAARLIKELCPGSVMVLGGHHPTAFPAEVMDCEAVDFVIRGEGEVALPLLVEAIKNNAPIDHIPGLVHRHPDGRLSISEPTYPEDLDQHPLPWPPPRASSRRSPRAVILTSRGCPMRCSYCSIGAGVIPYRRRSIPAVMSEMARAVEDQGARFIDFEDENLAWDPEWLNTLLGQVSERWGDLDLELRAMNGLMPRTLNASLIRIMSKAGFRVLNLSLGSINGAQLQRFRRPDQRPAFDGVLALAEREGLSAVGYIIVGAPGQRAEDSLTDLLYLATRRVLAGVSVFYPSPGSVDFQTCLEAGLLPEDFSLYRSTALPLSHTTSRDETVTLLRLGRLLNFIKSILDQGEPLPAPAPLDLTALRISRGSRKHTGGILLQAFLHDGILRGVGDDHLPFEHRCDAALCLEFRTQLMNLPLRGAGHH